MGRFDTGTIAIIDFFCQYSRFMVQGETLKYECSVQCNFSREDLKAFISQDCMLEKRNATFAFYQIFQWVCIVQTLHCKLCKARTLLCNSIIYGKAHSLACGLCAMSTMLRKVNPYSEQIKCFSKVHAVHV